MPLEIGAPFICMPKRQVASGPVIAEASVGAIQMRGFLMMFGNLQHRGADALREEAAPAVRGN